MYNMSSPASFTPLPIAPTPFVYSYSSSNGITNTKRTREEETILDQDQDDNLKKVKLSTGTDSCIVSSKQTDSRYKVETCRQGRIDPGPEANVKISSTALDLYLAGTATSQFEKNQPPPEHITFLEGSDNVESLYQHLEALKIEGRNDEAGTQQLCCSSPLCEGTQDEATLTDAWCRLALDKLIDKVEALKTLKPKKWLCIYAVNGFSYLVNQVASGNVTGTFIYPVVYSDKGNRITSQQCAKNCNEFDRVVFPFLRDDHFYSIMIDRKKKQFVVVDSAEQKMKMNMNYYQDDIAYIKKNVTGWWLWDDDWVTVLARHGAVEYPQQQNEFDCGVFTCVFFLFVSTYGDDDSSWVSRVSNLVTNVESDALRGWLSEVIETADINVLLNPPKPSFFFQPLRTFFQP